MATSNCSVAHMDRKYFVRDPLLLAMCSTWYLVSLLLKSGSAWNKLMMFSVAMPAFMRKEVSAKRTMSGIFGLILLCHIVFYAWKKGRMTTSFGSTSVLHVYDK